MKKLTKAMKKVDEKYVTVEPLTNVEKQSTYGGSSSDGDNVAMYGVPPIMKYGVPVAKYGVPPITKYGVPDTPKKYGLPPITTMYGIPSSSSKE